MARRPFDRHVERATNVLELVHTDICEPFNEIAREGFLYFTTFTDGYTRYGYIYLMMYKHESFERFKEFKAQANKQTNKHIKAIRSNCGGKYMSAKLAQFLKENGIVSQLTPLATPQLNNVVEYRNQTLLDMV